MRCTLDPALRSSRGPPPALLQVTLFERIPSEVLPPVAAETGVLRRHCKVDPVAFFRAVTLEAGSYLRRFAEQLRFVDPQKAPKTLCSCSSFHDRFTPERVEILH